MEGRTDEVEKTKIIIISQLHVQTKIEKVPRDIQGERSRIKDTASSGTLFSTIGE